MRKYLFLGLLMLLGCEPSSKWVSGEATVVAAGKIGDTQSYGYSITYETPESTATNADGEPIKGPIIQHGMSDKPVPKEQRLHIRYRRDEPLIFEFVDKMSFAEQ